MGGDSLKNHCKDGTSEAACQAEVRTIAERLNSLQTGTRSLFDLNFLVHLSLADTSMMSLIGWEPGVGSCNLIGSLGLAANRTSSPWNREPTTNSQRLPYGFRPRQLRLFHL